MRAWILAALPAVALQAANANAQGAFSEESEAQAWGLPTEQTARFEGQVVDILCELTGDCVDNCGGGDCQLGILRSADDVLVLVAKNAQPLFTGAVQDLLPYCGQQVEVDGLTIGNAMPGNMPYYQLQTIRAAGAEEWSSATLWTEVWEAANPEAAGEGRWYRRHPGIAALIERDGYLGLGPEADAAYIAERF